MKLDSKIPEGPISDKWTNLADFGLGTWHPKNGMYSVILAMEK